MERRPKIPALIPIVRIIPLVLLVLALGTPTAPTAADSNHYILQISQSKDPICVGDTVNVSIAWAPNTKYDEDDKNGLAPLTPLGGPSRIKLQASLGHFYPEEPPPSGSNTGTTTVAYIAEKKGNEKLFAVAFNMGSSDAIATTSFEVQDCEYIYTLNAQFDLGVSVEELSYTARYTVKARGVLKPADSETSQNLEARDNPVRLNAVVTSWSSSKCVLFTYEPGSGLGFVDAKASPGPMGIGMNLKIGAPRDLGWDVDLSFACNGDGHTVAFVHKLSESDPWIEVNFPGGSGSQDIKLDMFEVPYQKLLGSEGISVGYKATVTLEKQAPK